MPDWLKLTAGMLVVVALLTSLSVRGARQLRRALRVASARHELPAFAVKCVVAMILGIIANSFLAARRAGFVTFADILGGVGFGLVLVGLVVWRTGKADQERRAIVEMESQNAGIGVCAWCGIDVRGRRLSVEAFNDLPTNTASIAGQTCESCGALSCVGCRREAAGFNSWSGYAKSVCTKCNHKVVRLLVHEEPDFTGLGRTSAETISLRLSDRSDAR